MGRGEAWMGLGCDGRGEVVCWHRRGCSGAQTGEYEQWRAVWQSATLRQKCHSVPKCHKNSQKTRKILEGGWVGQAHCSSRKLRVKTGISIKLDGQS